jgi:hypothetical protein
VQNPDAAALAQWAGNVAMLEGVESAVTLPDGIEARFDVTVTNSAALEQALGAMGAGLPHSLRTDWSRAWRDYRESARREHALTASGWDAAVRALHAQCYRRERHGRRDDRRQQWRAYLAPDATKPGHGSG